MSTREAELEEAGAKRRLRRLLQLGVGGDAPPRTGGGDADADADDDADDDGRAGSSEEGDEPWGLQGARGQDQDCYLARPGENDWQYQ